MEIIVKINTHAASCDKDGVFSTNIRPNVYSRNTPSKVVKSGYYPGDERTRPYMWYVVEYWSSYSFVTANDIVKG